MQVFHKCKAFILKSETLQVDVDADVKDSQQECSTSSEIGDLRMFFHFS